MLINQWWHIIGDTKFFFSKPLPEERVRKRTSELRNGTIKGKNSARP